MASCLLALPLASFTWRPSISTYQASWDVRYHGLLGRIEGTLQLKGEARGELNGSPTSVAPVAATTGAILSFLPGSLPTESLGRPSDCPKCCGLRGFVEWR